MQYVNVLTIAGFDGSGGAGIQADLKTFAALGCYGTSVLTVLPVQNSQGVRSIYPLSPCCVQEQLQAIFDDVDIKVIKIGALFNADIIQVVAASLNTLSHPLIILDPVMVAKSGDALLSEDAIRDFMTQLLPLATVLTPNLSEASALLQRKILTKNQMEQAAYDLASMGPQAVVVKGGHLAQETSDDCLCLRTPPHIHWFSAPRILTKNTHGSGCTFAAAIAALLAHGHTILQAIELAKQYVTASIMAGAQYEWRRGNGPLHHFHSLWKTG